jgi:hypothetical protein
MFRVQVTSGCGGGMGLQLSPNPATSSTQLQALENNSFTQIRIVDKPGNVRRQVNYPKGTKKAILSVGELPTDITAFRLMMAKNGRLFPLANNKVK